MPQGLVIPSNSILYAGEPTYREYEVLTATNLYPGSPVETDTNEWSIKVGADNSTVIIGVADVEPNELKTTIYGAADQCRVITGDVVVAMRAASGASIGIGTKVQSAGSGTIDQYATVGADFGYALQTKTGDDIEWILVKLTSL